jgi:DNA polymerase-3 subunit alpha
MSAFAHLHVHTEYSPLDGLSRCDALARRAYDLGQPALAITDHGVLHGVVAFDRACRDVGIKPIIGCEIYMTVNATVDADRNAGERATRHLTVLADGDRGYRSLLRLTSDAWTTGFYGKPRVDMDALDRCRDGLIVLSGCQGGQLAQLLEGRRVTEAVALTYALRDMFGDRFYLEAMDTGLEVQRRTILGVKQISKSVGVQVVATADVHYVDESDWQLHRVLMAVQTQQSLASRPTDDGARYHLRSTEEMLARLPHAWVETAGDVASRCASPVIASARLAWPQAAGETLARAASTGMAWRYGDDWRQQAVLSDRFRHEMSTIEATGYVDYIRIVADLCAHARRIGVRTAARGSAAGSMILYALGITEVDPVAHRLSFERFLNEGRSPDIDLDFEDARRDEVLSYLAQRYGADHVAGICTFARMGGRTAIRDVGRAYDISPSRTSQIAEAFAQVEVQGRDDAWRRTLADYPDDVWLADAKRLDGTLRHVGRHAAGFVVGSAPLVETVPLIRDKDGQALCGLEMADVEACGLVKFDFLGLRTLSTVSRCVALCGIDIDAVPDGDAGTYQLLREGRTLGVFQLESAGMRRLLAKLRPTSLAHLSAMLALYRPGPIAHIDEYIARVNGSAPVTYIHERFRSCLEDTYGVVVYQEAILEAARDVAGLSPADADKLLSIVRKKRADLLPAWRQRFVDGCTRNGVPADKVQEFWSAVEPFAGYGFNRAHATAYARLTYQTAYLKANASAAFLCASLLSEDEPSAVASLILDARRMGVTTLSPCVLTGSADVEFVDDRRVRLGLSSVRGLGRAGADAIIEARRVAPFVSALDFRMRVPRRAVNVRALTALVDAGGLDAFGDRHATRMTLGQRPSTGGADDLRREAMALGLVVSTDVAQLVPWERLGRTMRSGAVTASRSRGRQTIGGVVVGVEQRRFRDGQRWWARIDDNSGDAWVMLPAGGADWAQRVVVGGPLVATGALSGKAGECYMVASSALMPWDSEDAQVMYHASKRGGVDRQ